jgi:predicted dehydrogenase
VKILIAGLGSIGQRHARNLRALLGDRLQLIAYRTRALPGVITEQMTIDPATSVEARYAIRSFSNLEEALAHRPVAAIVCNPTSLHVAVATAAVNAGAHVLIEKPLSDSIAGVDELIASAARRDLVAAVGYQMRFHPALQRLRQLLADDRIGRVVSVQAAWGEYLPDAHPYEDYRQSYAARADLGGGVILCFIHELDYLIWLFGMPRRVSAIGGRSGDLEVDVEDWAVTSMTTEHDGREIEIELRQSFAQRSPSRSCTVRGERGVIAVDLQVPSIEISNERGDLLERQVFENFERNNLFIDEMRHFLSAIDGGGAVAVSAQDGARSLRVALAVKQSLASGHAIDLQ